MVAEEKNNVVFKQLITVKFVEFLCEIVFAKRGFVIECSPTSRVAVINYKYRSIRVLIWDCKAISGSNNGKQVRVLTNSCGGKCLLLETNMQQSLSENKREAAWC